MINDQKIQSVDVQAPLKGLAAITHFEFAPGIGAATTALEATVDGQKVQVFANRDLTAFNLSFKNDPDASFKNFNVPLFPMTNRLLPQNDVNKLKLKVGDDFTTLIEKIPVKMPLNNVGHLPHAVPHHLHGLAYATPATEVTVTPIENGKKATAHFKNFFHGDWTSNADLTVMQSIQNGDFHYALVAKNTGTTPLPVAFGSHPYFQIPSSNPKVVTLMIPAGEIAELDNLDNVLPTGKFIPVSANEGRLDFTKAKALPSGVIDNFFVLDGGKRSVELVDPEVKLKYRMTALTPNIIGVQIYYPGSGSIIAIEMVTNLPDPRAERWKTISTGMQTLQLGESAQYEYQVSIEKL